MQESNSSIKISSTIISLLSAFWFFTNFQVSFLRGIKTYLSKWKGKGFDQDLKKLTGILEAGDVAHAQLLVRLY